jgi:RluA family pseudouridine synthase
MSAKIVYEDEYLAAFDKRSGMLVAPDRWDKEKLNLVEWVHEKYSPEWRNVHRLDRDTSGVVLFAKTAEMEAAMTALFEQHAVVKTYSALVRPAPYQASGVISMPLDDDPKRLGRMRVAVSGKPSRTEYLVVKTWGVGVLALLELHPLTGRTHQIRVHLAAIGSPVVCDPWYGDGRPLLRSDYPRRGQHPKRRSTAPEEPLLARLALHAHRLEFTHPATNAPCKITSPWPPDFRKAASVPS